MAIVPRVLSLSTLLGCIQTGRASGVRCIYNFVALKNTRFFKDPFMNIKTYANPMRQKKDRYRVTLIYKQQYTNSVTNTSVVVCTRQ